MIEFENRDNNTQRSPSIDEVEENKREIDILERYLVKLHQLYNYFHLTEEMLAGQKIHEII